MPSLLTIESFQYCHSMPKELCPHMHVARSENAQSAAEQAQPVPERLPAAVAPTEAAVVPGACRPANLPAHRYHPSPDLPQGINVASKRGADAAEAQTEAGQGARPTSHKVHTTVAAPQACSNWLPRLEGEQRKAWQDASRDATSTGDVQVRLYTFSNEPSLSSPAASACVAMLCCGRNRECVNFHQQQILRSCWCSMRRCSDVNGHNSK